MNENTIFPKLKIGKLEADLPIVQGGMAVRISLAPLAAAVANEGGIGLIAASGITPDELVRHIRQARELTKGIIGINVMVAVREFADLVKAAISEKIDLVVAGAGFSRDVFGWCKNAGVTVAPIVSSERVASLAEKFGADAIVVEGKEAGGHLGTDESLASLLPRILKKVKVPVIAAGGIINGRDIYNILKAGAKGVQIGTRFAMSKESSASEAMKKVWLRSTGSIITGMSPTGMPSRAVDTTDIEAMPKVGNRNKCVRCLKNCSHRDEQIKFCIIKALENAQEGAIDDGLVFCGERIGELHDIISVKEIMARFKREYMSVVREEEGVSPCAG